jgi:hypothetical protein
MSGGGLDEPGPSQGRLYQGVAKTDFGYRMLQTMGWCEGKVSAATRSSGPLPWTSRGG